MMKRILPLLLLLLLLAVPALAAQDQGACVCGTVRCLEGSANDLCEVCALNAAACRAPLSRAAKALMPKAAKGKLNIADGPIIITRSGYTQGDAAKETAYTGAITLTGSSATGTVRLLSGSRTLLLSGANLLAPSGEAPISIAGGAKLTLKLVGQNILTSDAALVPALSVERGGKAILIGSGRLYAYNTSAGAVYATAIIGGAGAVEVAGGTVRTVALGGGENIVGIGGEGEGGARASITIKKGTVIAVGQGANPSGIGCIGGQCDITIAGGTVTADYIGSDGAGAFKLAIKGGKLCVGALGGTGADTSIAISGGTVQGYDLGNLPIRANQIGAAGKKTRLWYPHFEGKAAESRVSLKDIALPDLAGIDAEELVLTGKVNATILSEFEAAMPTIACGAITGKGVLTLNCGGFMPEPGTEFASRAGSDWASHIKPGTGFSGIRLENVSGMVRAALYEGTDEALLTVRGVTYGPMTVAAAIYEAGGMCSLKGKTSQAVITLLQDAHIVSMPIVPATIESRGMRTLSVGSEAAIGTGFKNSICFRNIILGNPAKPDYKFNLGMLTLTMQNVHVNGSIVGGYNESYIDRECGKGVVKLSGTVSCKTIRDVGSIQMSKAKVSVKEGITLYNNIALTGKNTFYCAKNRWIWYENGSKVFSGSGKLYLTAPLGFSLPSQNVITTDDSYRFGGLNRLRIGDGLWGYTLDWGSYDNEIIIRAVVESWHKVIVSKGKTSKLFSSSDDAVDYINKKKLSGATMYLLQDVAFNKMPKYPVTIDGLGYNASIGLGSNSPARGSFAVRNAMLAQDLSAPGYALTLQNVDASGHEIAADAVTIKGSAWLSSVKAHKKLTLENKAKLYLEKQVLCPGDSALVLQLNGTSTITKTTADPSPVIQAMQKLTLAGSGKLQADWPAASGSGGVLLDGGHEPLPGMAISRITTAGASTDTRLSWSGDGKQLVFGSWRP